MYENSFALGIIFNHFVLSIKFQENRKSYIASDIRMSGVQLLTNSVTQKSVFLVHF